MRPPFASFSDGVLAVCAPTPSVSDFGAVKNVASASELDTLYVLPFSEMSRRQSDYEFAERAGHTLDLKVRVRRAPGLDASHRILIGRRLYSIYQIDFDALTAYMYLEEERRL